MKPTSTQKPEINLENWFYAHSNAHKVARFIIRPPEVTNMFNLIWPAPLDYFSPLNPAFLYDCINPNYMNRHSVWLIRDGLIPLLWFFKTNPEPNEFKSKILVREDLTPYVPTAWRKQAGSYRMTSHPGFKPKKTENVLIAGIAMESYCSVRAAKKIADNYLAKSKPSSKTKFTAFLPFRNDPLVSDRQHEFHGEFLQALMKRFGTDIKFANWTQLESMDSLNGYELLDLNEGLVCSDNYILHSAMSRGATLFDTAAKPSRDEKFVELSQYHGVYVKTSVSGQYALGPEMAGYDEAAPYLARVREAMRSTANLNFPWPAWFNEIAKEISESRWS